MQMNYGENSGKDDRVPEPYYDCDGITIYHGDCREILSHLPTVDLVLTDPPYGINWNTDYTRFSGERGVNQKYPAVHGDKEEFDPSPFMGFPKVILWGGQCYSNRLPLGTWLIWDKRFKNGEAFLADAEVAWMKGGYGVYIYSQTWQGSNKMGETERFHPTQKPAGLMRWCIEKVGKAQTILDPFMGSGTTLVAAKQLHRKAIGIEIEEKYCEVAAKRLGQGVLPI
jgi:DNA modification methylase